MKEVFNDVPGYEGMYQVSNLGRVKSLSRKVKNGMRLRTIKERILKPNVADHGYLNVALCNGKSKTFHIHQLTSTRNNSLKKNIKSSSKYTGVSWSSHSKKWMSQIMINGKIKHLGGFVDEYEASMAYESALNEIL